MTTSSDGILTVTADNTTASNKVTVDFTGYAGGVPAAAVNLLPNPASTVAASFALASAATATRVAATGTGAVGPWSTRIATTSAGTVTGSTPQGLSAIPVSPGVTYTGSAYVKANATARSSAAQIAWFDAAGAVITTISGTASNDTVGAWTRRTVSGAAPSNARYACILAYWTLTAVSEQHEVSWGQLEAAGAASTYVDGIQPGSYWTGVADSSVSVRPAYSQLTVRRADGTIVRGLNAAVAPGGILKGIDHEAPLGVAVVYTASLSNGYGTLTSTTATATITAPTDTAWLKSLLTPAISVAVKVRELPTIENNITVAALDVLGGRYPITQGDVEEADSGTISFITDTAAKRQGLSVLLRTVGAGPYLLQLPAAWDEPDRFITVMKRSRERLTRAGADPYRVTSLPFVEVARPTTAGSRVTIPGKTYADSSAALPLYSNRTGTYGARTV